MHEKSRFVAGSFFANETIEKKASPSLGFEKMVGTYLNLCTHKVLVKSK